MSRLMSIIVCMFPKRIFPILACLLFLGCNSAFRSSHTSVRLSPPVAEYLSQQTLLIHNNQPKLQTRQVTLQAPYADSFYTLRYRKLSGNSLILEVSDSTGKMRNVAIPQTKLKAFPIALTTTATPLILGGIFSYRDPIQSYYWDDLAAIGIAFFNASTDALAIPLTKLIYRHQHYAVPTSFVLSDLQAVQTLDTLDKAKLFTITAPVNPHVTPYLDADYQKLHQVHFSANGGYGWTHKSSSNGGSLATLPNCPWYALEFNVQTQENFRWGMHHMRNQDTRFNTNITSLQIAYVNNYLRNASLTCGVGIGFGSFKRNQAENLSLTSNLLNGKRLGPDSLVLIEKEFIPNLQYFFTPLSGFIQYERNLGTDVAWIVGFRMTQIKAHTDYYTRQSLQTWEEIAPGITAERIQNIGYRERESSTSTYMVFQGTIGLKIRIH